MNLYQLFLERALALLRHGGRLGLVLPAGFAVDHGAAAVRRAVLDRTRVDGWTLLENREGVFPIHRGLKFLLLTTTSGMATKSVPCRAGVRRPEVLDEVPDTGVDSASLSVTRALLERVIVEQAPLLDGKPVEVHLDIAPALASTVPASVLHILLSNLIGNAFAHAEDGAVEIGSGDGRLHIANRAAVLDSAAAQRLVDEPYARREGSAGFGLGLVIVRRLGERFGLDLRISLDEGAARASFRLTPGTGGTGAPPPAAE